MRARSGLWGGRATVAALEQARKVFQERIEARSARLIDTAGDSVLAEFPSVVEAVECAVAVQDLGRKSCDSESASDGDDEKG
jgi:class 3 adenylate cyclase